MEIQNIYEHHFPKLTERYFKDKNTYQPWPTSDVISDLVGGDEVFKILYKELYYRHLYSKLPNQLTLDHRFESYENYCDLFNQVLGMWSVLFTSAQPVAGEGWSFCVFRSLKK